MSAPEHRARRRRVNRVIDMTRPMSVVIYVRVSKDETGKHKSVGDQEAAIKATIKELGYPWTILTVLTDNDISASDKTAKERPGWDDLRALVRKGKADIVAVWEVSRLSRITKVGIDFMDECQDHGITGIFVAEGYGQLYRLDDAKDRSALRHEFSKAEDESDKIQVRVTRGQAGNREKGRPQGICPYGYVRTYDQVTREFTGHTLIEAEKAIIIEIIQSVADGMSPATVARRLNLRRVSPPTRPGSRVNKHGWATSTVQSICTNPVYIRKITKVPAWWNTEPGNRTHGATMGRNLSDLVDAPQYPRIVDDELFFRAAHNLTDRPRRSFNPYVEVTGERGQARHLLTHIAVCECGGNITPGNRQYQSAVAQGSNAGVKGKKGFQKLPEGTIRQKKVTRYYRCGKRMDVNVPEAAADEYVTALVIDKLVDLAGTEWVTGYDSEELYRTKAELAEREGTLAMITEQLTVELVKPGGGSPAIVASFRNAQVELEEEINRLKYDRERQALPQALRPFADCGDDAEAIGKVWDQLVLEGKRSVLRILAESIMFKRAKHAGRGQQPVSERIEVTWNPIYIVAAEGGLVVDGGERIEEITG
jgi:DNA invertase Pin-like site-specific DNA recombinase